ncbi:MAG: hypothetical protein QOF60_2666, partial [Actinomycetota bacterium]|nr:hypothetical protein [Actinomycetota bacterium]
MSWGFARLQVALVATIAAAGAMALGLVAWRDEQAAPVLRTPSRQQLEAYEDALTPHAKRGGFIVEEGLKYGLGQVSRDEGGPVPFQAISWADQLTDVRREFNAQSHFVRGTRLEPAVADFDAAFALYIDAARTIGAAAIASGEPRRKLVDQAAETGRRADANYDAASALIQRFRREHGLPPTARFPDP